MMRDMIRSLVVEIFGAGISTSGTEGERERVQKKQGGGHRMPPRPDDAPALDNTDKIISPSKIEDQSVKRH